MREWMRLFESEVTPAETFVAHFADEGEHMPGVYADLEAYEPNAVYISMIERGHDAPAGSGKAVLMAMGQLADQLGITLTLRVAPEEEGGENTKLVDYYKALGFTVTGFEDDPFGGSHMERSPN